MIIDFHAHLLRHPVKKQYDLDDLWRDMDENGIDVRMISALEGKSIADQNDTVARLARSHPDRLLACAAIDPKQDDCIEEARRVAGIREIRALEFNSWEHGYLPERYAHHLDPIFDIAEEAGLPVKLFAGWGARSMPHQWAQYAHRHPGVTFVVLHIGGIDFGYGSIDLVRDTPNMMFETSGQTELQVLRKAFADVSADRFLFGSNYPEHFTRCSIDTFDVLDLPEETRAAMFYGNARKLLRL